MKRPLLEAPVAAAAVSSPNDKKANTPTSPAAEDPKVVVEVLLKPVGVPICL
jgi:hypothetical protein